MKKIPAKTGKKNQKMEEYCRRGRELKCREELKMTAF